MTWRAIFAGPWIKEYAVRAFAPVRKYVVGRFLGRVVQFASSKSRVESTYGFSARNY
jgi:hypothetical protein